MARPSIIELSPVALSDTDLTAKLLRALGDPTRLKIVELLLEGPRFQKDIVDQVELSQGQVSNHLACLTWCGFVEAERHGRLVEYRIGDPRVVSIIDLARAMLHATDSAIASCRRIDGTSD